MALEQEHAQLMDAGLPATLLHLGREVFDAASASARLSEELRADTGATVRFVLLDGLDEGLSDIPGLGKVLLHHLKGLTPEERHGLRLRIACRTTRWPETVEAELRALWPADGEVAVVTLAPLSRSDMRAAAEQHGLDGAAFVERLVDRSLEALAQQPVTLVSLLESQARGEQLPTTVVEAYEQACRMLCTETWDEDFSRRQERPAVEHLLAIARWVAAALQFARCAALVDGPHVGEGELHLDMLATQGVPGLFPTLDCRRHELLHLTESGLLAPVGQRRWVFAHRSYQEHLAAEFLKSSGMAPAAQAELLWVGSGRARHIVPEHEEVAARLAVSDDRLFEDLLAHDPRVLLLADLRALPVQHRARVTRALLDNAPNEGFERIDWGQLERLDHSGLAEQLEPFLQPGADRDQQYLALWIAAACQPAGLGSALLDVAEDRTEPAYIRSFALQALAEVDDQAAERLRRLATDPASSVAEAAVTHLWSQHLSLIEYLDLLPDPDHWSISRSLEKFTELATPERLDDLLSWSTRILERQSPKVAVAVTLLTQCVEILGRHPKGNNQARFEEQAGRALIALASHHVFLSDNDAHDAIERLRIALNGAVGLRRRLAGYVLHHGTQDDVLSLLFAHPDPGLFPAEDLPHWATAWPDLRPEERHAALPLFSRRPRPDDPLLLQAIDHAREIDSELRKATEWWDAPESEQEQKRRERREEEQRRRTFDKERFAAALRAVAVAEPQTVRTAWRMVIGHLYRTADGAPAKEQAFLRAVVEAPSYPAVASDLCQELLMAAARVLVTVPVWTGEESEPWGAGYRDVPELIALGFVPAAVAEAAVSETDTARWAGWALALATLRAWPQEKAVHHELLSRCAHKAGTELERVLERCLGRLDHHTLAVVVHNLQAASLEAGLDIMRRWATAPGRAVESWAGVLGTLAQLGHVAAQAHLREVVVAGPQGDTDRRERWLRAVRILMDCDNLTAVWPAVRRQFDDPGLCTEVIDRVVAYPGAHRWPKGVAGLGASDLADLYIRLCARAELQQPRPEHEPGVAYTITRAETLHDLADSLPGIIADKTTAEAAEELSRLAELTPRDPRLLRRLARRAACQAAEQYVQPLQPRQLEQLVADHHLRVVSDETQLLDVVMETLEAVQGALSGPNGLATLLWNRSAAAPSSSWWPMWEEDFSDLVAGLLKLHLEQRRVVINREVQVNRPGVAGGGRTDIHIQAATARDDPAPFTVVIECKGCWNSGLSTALTDQLVARYLRHPRTAGILLVGFFDCDLWDPAKRTRCSPSHSPEQLEQEQHEQATRHDVPVRAKVLDCRPPGAQAG
ncbi:hypothetical protein [Streptomyces glaucosporus]|uniref:NACHT domain-containing protein n=1 Tax=Streptomyces glaucosporus TaxID=284044 RepID=UPI0031D2D49B